MTNIETQICYALFYFRERSVSGHPFAFTDSELVEYLKYSNELEQKAECEAAVANLLGLGLILERQSRGQMGYCITEKCWLQFDGDDSESAWAEPPAPKEAPSLVKVEMLGTRQIKDLNSRSARFLVERKAAKYV